MPGLPLVSLPFNVCVLLCLTRLHCAFFFFSLCSSDGGDWSRAALSLDSIQVDQPMTAEQHGLRGAQPDIQREDFFFFFNGDVHVCFCFSLINKNINL